MSIDIEQWSIASTCGQELKEVGKNIGRPKNTSLTFPHEGPRDLRLPELKRERFIKFGKAHAGGTAPRSWFGISVSKEKCDERDRRYTRDSASLVMK